MSKNKSQIKYEQSILLGHPMSKLFGSRAPKFNKSCLRGGEAAAASKNFFLALAYILYTAFLILPATASASLTDGLVGWWTFDGKDTNWTSNTTLDKSGNGNTGTMTNMSTSSSPVAGKVGQGFNFDGANDSVLTSGTANLQTPSEISGSFWIKPKIITGSIASNRTAANNGWSMGFTPGAFRFTIQNVANYDLIKSFTLNVWQHVVYVFKNNTICFYSNAILAGCVGTGAMTTGDVIALGATGPTGSLTNFNGAIDDARLYNYALSTSTIQQLYKLGSNKVAASTSVAPTDPLNNGLVGWWTFDGKDTNWTTNTTLDRSGSGNTGKMTNMSTTSSPTQGKIGQGLNFDGVNDSVITSGTSNVTAPSSLTVSLWLNPKLAANTFFVSNTKTGNTGWSAGMVSGTGVLRFTIQGVASYDSSTAAVTLNRWQHIVYVFENQTIREYIDGVIASNPVATGAMTTGDIVVLGAAGPTGSSNYLAGKLDDVRIYNRALSTSTIQMLYNAGRGKTR